MKIEFSVRSGVSHWHATATLSHDDIYMSYRKVSGVKEVHFNTTYEKKEIINQNLTSIAHRDLAKYAFKKG